MRILILAAPLIFAVLLAPLLSHAQEPTSRQKNAIYLLAGLENGSYKDLNYSPLNYSSKSLALKLGYHRSFKNKHQVFLASNFLMGELSTDASVYHTSDHYNVDIRGGYMRALNSQLKTKVYFGGQLHSFLDLVFYDGAEAVSFYGLHSIDIIIKVSRNITSRGALSSSISLPVFGLLVRPPHTGWDKYIVEHQDNTLPIFFRGNWTSLNDYFAFTWNVEYLYRLGSNLDLLAQNQFRYYKTEMLKTAILASNQLTMGLRFNF